MRRTLQLDSDDLKKFARLFLIRMQELQTELMTYKSVVEVLRLQEPELINRLEKGVRERPELKQTLDELHQKMTESIVASIEEGMAEGALAQFLREWKAEGLIN